MEATVTTSSNWNIETFRDIFVRNVPNISKCNEKLRDFVNTWEYGPALEVLLYTSDRHSRTIVAF